MASLLLGSGGYSYGYRSNNNYGGYGGYGGYSNNGGGGQFSATIKTSAPSRPVNRVTGYKCLFFHCVNVCVGTDEDPCPPV